MKNINGLRLFKVTFTHISIGSAFLSITHRQHMETISGLVSCTRSLWDAGIEPPAIWLADDPFDLLYRRQDYANNTEWISMKLGRKQ